jgi:DNA-binding NtrC family response regulator
MRRSSDDAISRLFFLSSSPDTDLEVLLTALLQSAVAATASNAGGALFFTNPDSQERTCHLQMAPEAVAGQHEWLSSGSGWKRPRPPFGEAQLGTRVCKLRDAPSHHEPLQLFQEVRATARVTLFLQEEPAGFVQVESLDNHTESQRQHLRELAASAEALIWRTLLHEHASRQGLDLHMVGKSRQLLDLEREIRLVGSSSRCPVLILGERGSGKELAAYAIHYSSDRRSKPFLPLNSAVLSETLFADELFGHERGAFTGAVERRAGVIQAAEGGTLFIDEIGDLVPQAQAALLRFLDQGELRTIGSDKPRRLDVRIVAATNKNLPQLVEEGKFRADFYDRLNVFQIRIPPLRERREDVRLLINYFLKKTCSEIGRKRRIRQREVCEACTRSVAPLCTHPAFYQALEEYEFPGNVRELRNLLVRLAAIILEDRLRPEHAALYLREGEVQATDSPSDLSLDAAVRRHIDRVLQITGYNKSAAARSLHVPLTTLINKMKRLGMS